MPGEFAPSVTSFVTQHVRTLAELQLLMVIVESAGHPDHRRRSLSAALELRRLLRAGCQQHARLRRACEGDVGARQQGEGTLLALIDPSDETRPYIYAIRLVAFRLMIVGMVDKNRAGSR